MDVAQRKFFVGGNWKCNGDLEFIDKHFNEVLFKLGHDKTKCDVLIAPVFIHLQKALSLANSNDSGLIISAQNCSLTAEGAFTGEVAARLIKNLGVNWTILGHSERRTLYRETNEKVGTKVKNAMDNGLNVVACIGETLQEREEKKTLDVCYAQLKEIAASVTDWSRVVIAYEPIWAIGTGKTPTVDEAQEVHLAIRSWISKNVNVEAANGVRIIYGGSVTDTNAESFAKMSDIDGFLVGGASLKPAFSKIVNAYTVKGLTGKY